MTTMAQLKRMESEADRRAVSHSRPKLAAVKRVLADPICAGMLDREWVMRRDAYQLPAVQQTRSFKTVDASMARVDHFIDREAAPLLNPDLKQRAIYRACSGGDRSDAVDFVLAELLADRARHYWPEYRDQHKQTMVRLRIELIYELMAGAVVGEIQDGGGWGYRRRAHEIGTSVSDYARRWQDPYRDAIERWTGVLRNARDWRAEQ